MRSYLGRGFSASRVVDFGVESLDILVITETWHECSESTLVNHGRLALAYCQDIKIKKRFLKAAVTTTFEYICE